MAILTRNNIVTNGLVLTMDVANSLSYSSGSLKLSNMVNPNVSGSISSSAQYSNYIAPSLFLTGSSIPTNIPTYNTWSVGLISNIENLESRLVGTTNGQTIFFWNSSSITNQTLPGRTVCGLSTFLDIMGLTIDNSGSLYIGGQFNGYQNVSRAYCFKLNNSGSLINQFNIGYDGLYSVYTVGKLELDNSGSLYGTAANLFTGDFKVNKDTGAFISSSPYDNSSITSTLTLDTSSNSMYIGTYATTYQNSSSGYFVKVDKDTYQRDFNFNTHTSGGFNNNSISIILLDSNQNLFIGGGFTSYQGNTANYIIKVDKNTAVRDTSFNTGTGFNNTVTKIIPSHDGKIYATGLFSSYSGSSVSRIVKLNLDGTIDTSFNIGNGFNSGITAATQADGKLIAVGSFTSYSGSAVNRIVRINTNGTIDSTFNIGTGFNTNMSQVLVQPDGKIVVVGLKGTYNGVSHDGIIRLKSDGSVDPDFIIDGGSFQPLHRVDFSTHSPTLRSLFAINTGFSRVSYSKIYEEFGKFNYYNITYDPSIGTIKLYINGVLRGVINAGIGSNYPLELKYMINPDYGNYFSYLHAYNRELTPQEILQNYNATKGRYGL